MRTFSLATAAMLLALSAAAPAQAGNNTLLQNLGNMLLNNGQPQYGSQGNVNAKAAQYGYLNQYAYEQDAAMARSAQARALNGPLGQTWTWSNQTTGNQGAIQVVDEGYQGNEVCRTLAQEVVVNGMQRQNQGMACRYPNSGWRIVR